ncbi:MAG TPA: helix-turn-helix transcriptional regulator [Thermobifida alba]|nr:helix-turn-helix transcriptional regulator [Thermobifida alba]
MQRDPSEMSPAHLLGLRRWLGLTVRAMAAAVGQSYQTVTRWESGERRLSEQSAAALRDLVAYTEETVEGLAAAAPAKIVIYRTDAEFQANVDTGGRVLSAAWHQMVAVRAADRCGAEIVYE